MDFATDLAFGLRANDLIELLREIGGVPIEKLERACAICGLVGQRKPKNRWSKIGGGEQLVIHAGKTGAADLEIGVGKLTE